MYLNKRFIVFAVSIQEKDRIFGKSTQRRKGEIPSRRELTTAGKKFYTRKQTKFERAASLLRTSETKWSSMQIVELQIILDQITNIIIISIFCMLLLT